MCICESDRRLRNRVHTSLNVKRFRDHGMDQFAMRRDGRVARARGGQRVAVTYLYGSPCPLVSTCRFFGIPNFCARSAYSVSAKTFMEHKSEKQITATPLTLLSSSIQVVRALNSARRSADKRSNARAAAAASAAWAARACCDGNK